MRKSILSLVVFILIASITFASSDTLIDSRIEINDVLIFNKSIIEESDSRHNEIIKNKNLIITYKEKEITIHWGTTDTVDISNYTFAYTLEGFDKRWCYTDEHTATYTNLDPGQYRFRLKWAKDEIWTNTPVYLDIRIIPLFWQTWWSRILPLFIIFGLFIIIIIIRLKKKRKKMIEN